MLKGKYKTRIFIFAVVFDIVLDVEQIWEDDFYLIRIHAACIPGQTKFFSNVHVSFDR